MHQLPWKTSAGQQPCSCYPAAASGRSGRAEGTLSRCVRRFAMVCPSSVGMPKGRSSAANDGIHLDPDVVPKSRAPCAVLRPEFVSQSRGLHSATLSRDRAPRSIQACGRVSRARLAPLFPSSRRLLRYHCGAVGRQAPNRSPKWCWPFGSEFLHISQGGP